MWQWYSIACHEGVSTHELVLTFLARDYRHAVETLRKWGYVPAQWPP